MRKHQHAVLLQQIPLKNQVGNLWQFRQCIWRVGKDHVKLLVACSDKAEHVAADGDATVCAQFLQTLFDKSMMVAVGLHAHHLPAFPRH